MKIIGNYPPRAEVAEFPRCYHCGATMIGFAPVYQHIGGQQPDVPFWYCPECVDRREAELQDARFEIAWEREIANREPADTLSLGMVKQND